VSDQGTHAELLRDAVRGGTSDVVRVAHEVGASAAQTGVPLHEVLDHVERAYAPGPPDFAVARAAALAWADDVQAHLADVSCHDPLTSLATVPHLRSRLGETYQGAGRDGVRACDTHVLVVVELARSRPGNEIEQALHALDVAEVLRTVFTGDETITQLTDRRFAVLTARERADGVAIDLLGLLLDRTPTVGGPARLWVERLPASADGICPVLVALCG